MTTERRRGLGRGLGSLIPTGPRCRAGGGADPPPASDATPPAPAGAYFAELPITQVAPNHVQPRQVFDEEAMAELVHSIREVGLLQPVVVRRSGPESYELVMGERRWRATQEAGLETIPAIVRQTDDADMLRDALLENLHRSQLNPLEEAAAYRQLLEDFSCTHEELAERIGRSPSADQQHDPAAQALARGPAAGRRRRALGRARPRRCSPSTTPSARTGSPAGWSPRASACAASRRSSPSASPSAATPPVRRRKPTAPGLHDLAERLSRPARDPGQGRPRSAQGQDHRRVRLARRPARGSSTSWTRATGATDRSSDSSISRLVDMST